jgi:hypothetical protein
MNRLSRSNALKIAAVISFLLGAYGFVESIPYLVQGDVVAPPGVNEIPYFVIVAAFVFNIVRIVGAYGTWNRQRWGIVLTLIVNAIDSILAAPGIFFGPTLYLQIGSAIGIIASVAVIVLCLWRDRRPAVV